MSIPTAITLEKTEPQRLTLSYADGSRISLTSEYLRVNSPSADVQGHGPGQETLQVGKKDVAIIGIETVGNYAIRPRFSDGHHSGIYRWDYLRTLAEEEPQRWAQYLADLAAAGKSRETSAPGWHF